MTNSEFQALCRGTSLLLGLADTQALARDNEIVLDGIRIGVFYDDATDTAIHFFIELGPVDENRPLEVLQRVLQLNLELGRMHGETLGYDKESNNLVLRAEMKELASCTPENMAEWLRDYAAFKRELDAHLNEFVRAGDALDSEHIQSALA
jgi:hypothetical protein